jgi:DNA processing protein
LSSVATIRSRCHNVDDQQFQPAWPEVEPTLPTPETVLPGDARYPAALDALEDPPARLWSIGDWSVADAPVVAVVGTRRATPNGLRVTRDLVTALARAGACVVSGMALGIDAAAHRAALDANGRTAAVLGTGVDIAYPRSHRMLHAEIAANGLLISELPPGAHSHGGSFPMRNRIIAAIARLTIVVEAPVKSGALITARHALDLGRDIGIVPGPIDAPQSQGSNELLRDGAHPIASIADAVTLAGLTAPKRGELHLDDETELRVWTALAQGAASLDELCTRSALPVARCLSTITALELRGVVECALTGEIRRR